MVGGAAGVDPLRFRGAIFGVPPLVAGGGLAGAGVVGAAAPAGAGAAVPVSTTAASP